MKPETSWTFMALILVLLFSCDGMTRMFCGDLDQSTQNKIRGINEMHKSVLFLSAIPCETYTINLFLKSSRVDTVKISKIHKIIYDRKTGKGWESIDVYSENRECLFSHFYSGKINLKSEL